LEVVGAFSILLAEQIGETVIKKASPVANRCFIESPLMFLKLRGDINGRCVKRL